MRITMSRLFASVSVSVFLFFGGLVLTAPDAYAIGVHNSNITPASAYTEFAEMFPSVGGLFTNSDTEPDNFGSGVLIHPNFVLTAGHVALTNDNNASSFYDEFLFVLGANTSTAAEEFQFADEVFLAPGYSGVEQGVDLALLYFETPFTSAAPADIYEGAVQVGDVASIVGYGLTGTPATGASAAQDGVKRAGQNVIESTTLSDDYLFYRFSRSGDPNFLELGAQGLPGDSGGGWFIDTPEGFQLAGISSGGSANPAYAASTTAVQVALGLDFINETIASRTAVPEPASALLLAAGLPFFRRLRRRLSW